MAKCYLPSHATIKPHKGLYSVSTESWAAYTPHLSTHTIPMHIPRMHHEQGVALSLILNTADYKNLTWSIKPQQCT